MDLQGLGLTFLTVGAQEIGDKTQILCLVLATRWGSGRVLLGAALAMALMNLLAVAVGDTLASMVPVQVARGIAAGVFLFFGIMAVRSRYDFKEEDSAEAHQIPKHPVLATLGLVTLAEMFDRTQLIVASLATGDRPAQVWFASTAAVILVTAVTVQLGGLVIDRLSRPLVQMASAGLMLGLGCVFFAAMILGA